MIIDCDQCANRGVGCSDCVISVLLDAPSQPEFEEPELRALGTLADAGLVPKLRLIPIHTARRGRDVRFDTPTVPDAAANSAERSEITAERQRRQVS